MVGWLGAAQKRALEAEAARYGEFLGLAATVVLAPGRQAYVAHYHLLEEEQLLVLEGRPTLRLGERRIPMEPGSYVVFPAGQKAGHALVNETDEPVRYLIIGERNPNEVTVHTDTGRVGVRLVGEGYRMGDSVDYWDGE